MQPLRFDEAARDLPKRIPLPLITQASLFKLPSEFF